MIKHFKKIIKPESLDNLYNYLSSVTDLEWNEGYHTTGKLLKSIKKNKQLALKHVNDKELKKIISKIFTEFLESEECDNCFSFGYPLLMRHYLINKYEKNDAYGFHTDRIYSKGRETIQNSNFVLSITINNDYEGGEFLVNDYRSDKEYTTFKQNKGDVILIEPQNLHKINKVTKGIRYGLIIWGANIIDIHNLPIFRPLCFIKKYIYNLNTSKKSKRKILNQLTLLQSELLQRYIKIK